MNESDKPTEVANVPEAIVDAESKGFPVVWLLPLVALMVGGWLLYKTISEKGPEIVIRFQTAEGIEEGKTKVKYRDVTIGQVATVRFAEDLSHVLVTAEMVPGTSAHLTDTTSFWVVRPRVGAGQISGLGTLISGAYIGMDPGEGGKSERRFKGLEKPPIITSDVEGTSYHLHADKLGSLTVGSPVYFRQIVVGEVTDYSLDETHEYVNIGVFIRAPHDQYVRKTTRFWNVGGVDLSLDASGVKVQMESLVALMTGGIAFETPESLVSSEQAAENTMYPLYASHSESAEQPITTGYPYVLNFTDSVRGLSPGAPVEFHGIRFGTVKAVETRLMPEDGELTIPVHIVVEPERTLTTEEIHSLTGEQLAQRVRERVEELVERGLRARLQTGNLITGQLFVELDMYPDAAPAKVIYGDGDPVFPTVPGTLAGITQSVNNLLSRLEKAPLEDTVKNLNQLVVSTNSLVATLDRETPALADDARATLENAADTLASLQGIASKDGEIGNELYKALEELRSAARSIRVMSEYLERHPEALLKGKGVNP